jgi:hypothetical protein
LHDGEASLVGKRAEKLAIEPELQANLRQI